MVHILIICIARHPDVAAAHIRSRKASYLKIAVCVTTSFILLYIEAVRMRSSEKDTRSPMTEKPNTFECVLPSLKSGM